MIDETMRPGPVARLLIFAAVLTVTSVMFFLFREQLEEPVLLAFLGLLAMIGVGYLFATVVGIVKIAPRSASDELSRAFVDTMAHGLVVTDGRDRIIYANRAWASLTGAIDAKDIRTPRSLLSDEPNAGPIVARLDKLLSDGKSGEGEFRLATAIAPGGEPVPHWYRLRARTFQVPGQRRPASAWQLMDITEERTEQERFFQELQHAIDHLDHAPAGYFSTDADGRLTYVNATLAEWLGFDLGSFLPGQTSLATIVAGDGMAQIRSVRAPAGNTRDAVLDLDMATVDGAALPVRLMHRVTTNRDGSVSNARTIVLNRTFANDVTANTGAAEARFTRFFNSTPMAIASVDEEGRIVRTNAPFLRLFSAMVDQAALDHDVRFENVIADADRPAFRKALQLASDGQADIAPLETCMPSAPDRQLRCYIHAVVDAGVSEGEEEARREVGIVYAVETTEQKALEQQMVQSQKMQAVGQLAGGIAHDFNNVLTAIIMATDLLLIDHRPTDPSFQDIMNIKQNANRAASLVRQLLAFSRRQTLRPEVLDLTDVMADLRMLLTRLAGTKVDLKVEHGHDLWRVFADLGQFEQVIVNLVVNARDAMADGGKVTVRTRNISETESRAFDYRELEPADYVAIEVQDTGTGIEPDVIKKIFEPFFTTKEVGKGTGLGLSMVYGFVKQSGGFVYADSTPGQGTVFRIFLPRYSPSAAAEAAEAEALAVERNGASAAKADAATASREDLTGTATVLLVEDEDAVRMGNVRALATRGYNVYEAASGVEALEVFDELAGEVDIVVSDVVMPEMDGPTLLRELRARNNMVKFIFVSGYAEEAFSKNLPEDANFGFLAKPFSLKQLAATVKEMLEKDD
ncbi:ATP-binding protein [Notoacmeibacter sp. MSK16QG-6]|nr:PAS domain-containing sensor histidine kinase [Notoacmeibacter sp. MSK16QG-6]MCP1197901.1 ATP-binding protein [Notoacmeibacter sp. MSK16QG-6]